MKNGAIGVYKAAQDAAAASGNGNAIRFQSGGGGRRPGRCVNGVSSGMIQSWMSILTGGGDNQTNPMLTYSSLVNPVLFRQKFCCGLDFTLLWHWVCFLLI